MITEELFRVVTHYGKYRYTRLSFEGNLVKVSLDGQTHFGSINIYELAHKCKEWAFWNDYYVITKLRMPDIYRGEHKIDYGVEIYQQDNLVKQSWWAESEPKAILQACEWILEQQKESKC